VGLTALMVGPLRGKSTILINDSPTLGDINIYNTTAAGGSLSMYLPQLGSGIQTAGANMLLEKDLNDVTSNTLTFNCVPGDSFADGSTSLVLTASGAQRMLEVITISGVYYWKVIGGLGTATTTINSPDDEGQFGENPDDVSPVAELTLFGESLPTGTGYGGFGDGLYGYLYGYGY